MKSAILAGLDNLVFSSADMLNPKQLKLIGFATTMEQAWNIYDENDYLFEDWYSDGSIGMRMRTGGSWEDGWSVKFDKETCKLLSMTTSGKEYLYNSVCRNCQYFRGACRYV